jgi:hypothetical protein
MKMLRVAALVAGLVSVSGCYHATIETGLAASQDTIDIPWAHSFIYGLVPPQVVSAASRCTNGVATVVTEHSFLNGLAAAVTFGIYTPMHITVTCSSGGRANDDAAATIEAKGNLPAALTEAVNKSAETGKAVLVKF